MTYEDQRRAKCPMYQSLPPPRIAEKKIDKMAKRLMA
jgi:hypothetical protein